VSVCYIGSNFVGALIYADDIVLIAPTATAFTIFKLYAMSMHVIIAKTKCLVIVPCRRRILVEELHECVFYIGNIPLEYVNSFCHLGHLINSELRDDEDITNDMNNFTDQVNNTLSYFRSLDSIVQHKLFQSYCTRYYGCELWLLKNPKLEDLCCLAKEHAKI